MSLVSRCIYLYLAILQQIHCILLHPTVSSYIHTYLALYLCAVSRCVLYLPPSGKRDMIKITLKGKAGRLVLYADIQRKKTHK